MFTNIKEGDLYKSVTVFGKTFDLYYGYYEDYERHSRFNEPVPIYPNFRASPEFSDEGHPFATEMQEACEHYEGPPDESICYGCVHFRRGEELIGVCQCRKNKI